MGLKRELFFLMLVLVRHLCSYLETVSSSSVMRQTTPESASCRAKCSIEGMNECVCGLW